MARAIDLSRAQANYASRILIDLCEIKEIDDTATDPSTIGEEPFDEGSGTYGPDPFAGGEQGADTLIYAGACAVTPAPMNRINTNQDGIVYGGPQRQYEANLPLYVDDPSFVVRIDDYVPLPDGSAAWTATSNRPVPEGLIVAVSILHDDGAGSTSLGGGPVMATEATMEYVNEGPVDWTITGDGPVTYSTAGMPFWLGTDVTGPEWTHTVQGVSVCDRDFNALAFYTAVLGDPALPTALRPVVDVRQGHVLKVTASRNDPGLAGRYFRVSDALASTLPIARTLQLREITKGDPLFGRW